MNVAEIATARLIGAVFVERGILSESQIRVALEIQRETGQQLGQILVERFGVTRQELASVVAEQWADIGRSSPPGVDAAANESWRRLGEIFVERGFVTPEQLEEALQRQRATGERVGEALVAQGSISKFELAGALAEQMSALEESKAAEAEPALREEATVVSLASRLEEHAPVEEQVPQPQTPVDEPVPSFGQTAASPEPLPFGLVRPEPAREPEPVGSPEPPVEEAVPVLGQTVVAPPEPVSSGVPSEEEHAPEPREEPKSGWQSAPDWQLPAEWRTGSAAEESEPESSLPSLVGEPAPLDPMIVVPVEAESFGLVQQVPEAESLEPEREAALAWVAFASTTAGYRLVQVDGPVPAVGETISVADVGEVVVLRLGRSPVPHDTRPCVFLEQVARVDAPLLV